MKILQISPECYPAAKAGGLGDVVGALPKYLNKIGQNTAVIIPKYQTKWLLNQSYSEVYRGAIRLFRGMVPFSIEYVNNNDLGYSLYVANIPGKFDRPGIYQAQDGTNFGDDIERWLCFQQAALHWIRMMDIKPSILHCHDHQTGLIPYFLKYSPDYKMMDFIPTVFTIHNGEYHGAYGWNKDHLLPYYDSNARGLLDWNDTINPLASAIRTCWRLTTVSPNYMEELRTYSNGLEGLIRSESIKSRGILNGIDVQVWDPSTDPFLPYQFGGDIKAYKTAN
ncbi:MAG: glycogen/starch synthase, partial [Bacteroidota bacterium]